MDQLDRIQNSTAIERPSNSTELLHDLQAQAQAMDAALKLGTALASTDVAAKDYRGKPHNAAAAILYGAEIGLKAIQSLQQVFIVHGNPAIYARTMVALVQSHGYSIRTVESTDQSVTVRGVSPAGGEEISTWDIARAKKAGYTKNPKYTTNPQEMLYAKAASEVCRRLAPEVLLGIAFSKEELELEPQPVRVRARRTTPVESVMSALSAPAPEPVEPSAPTYLDTASVIAAIETASTFDELTEVINSAKGQTDPEDNTALNDAVEAAKARLAEESIQTEIEGA